MNHPTGANIAAVAATMNTNAGGVGQFYSDGTSIYLVASDNSNPNTNGKTYTRSRYRTGGNAAVYANALDQQIIGLQVSKTCLANPTSNDPYIAYGIGGDGNFGGAARISNCTVTYGSKHCIGLTENVTSTEIVLVDGCDAEQGSLYPGSGGQTPYVSYTSLASGTAGVGPTHNYVNCTCLRPAGLLGSSTGDPSLSWNTFLTHNNGGTGQFLAINWINANTTGIVAAYNAVQNLAVVDSACSGVNSGATVATTVDRVRSNYFPFLPTSTGPLTATNCIYAPTLVTSSAPAQCQAAGTVVYQGCVIDLTNCAMTPYGSASSPFTRTGALNFTLQDCAVITNGGTNGNTLLYGALSTDTIVMDHNAYQAVSGAPIFGSYNDGSTTAGRTLAQLQTLSKEQASSAIATSLGLAANYAPRKTSPVIRAGVTLAALSGSSDYVGTPRPSAAAPDIGAVQYFPQPAGGVALSEAAAMGFDEFETS